MVELIRRRAARRPPRPRLGRGAAVAWARAALLACVALLACAGTARADVTLSPPPLSFVLSPAVTIPLGPGAEYFLPGGAAELAVEYALPSVPLFSLGGDILYGFTPIADGLGTTSQFAGLLGAAWRVPVVGRLSARVFARGGYELGVLHGDAAPVLGGGLLAEGGAGLLFTVSPFAVARLDTSYSYLFGSSGSLKVSVGLSVRPRLGAAPVPTTGKRPTALEIGEIDLQSVYPALRRSTDNRPAGKVLIRNAGKGSITDLHVSFLARGVMDNPRESGARALLKAGDTWEAPLVVLLGPGTVDDRGASAPSEVLVSWVEQGEQWEARKSATLRVQGSHTIEADDLAKVAAFVLSFDPSVRGLASAITAAIGAQVDEGVGPSVRAAIAAREAIRLMGIRVTADPAAAPAATDSGAPLRHMKYAPETLRDRAGTSDDVAVLCASLLEAAGVRAALVQANGKMLVAVAADDAADAPQLRAVAIIQEAGHRWVPFRLDHPAETFRESSTAAALAWKSDEGAGDRALVSVREAQVTYPASPLSGEGPTVRVPPAQQLQDAFQSAVAVFIGKEKSPRAAAPDMERAARRLLVVFQPHPAAAYSEIQRASLADSLALSLRRATSGVMVIPYGDTDFPGPTDKRVEAARERGADCYVVVGLSGDGQPAVITAESYDLLSEASAIAPATAVDRPIADSPGPDWTPVVSLVATAYGKASDAAPARTENP